MDLQRSANESVPLTALVPKSQIVGAQRFSSEPSEGKARAVECEDRLAIRLTHLDGVAVLAVRGEIDALTAPHFQESVHLACEQGVPVVLNMARVTFMDSAGISVLVVTSGVADGLPSTIRIQDPSDEVRRILSIAGLDDVYQLET